MKDARTVLTEGARILLDTGVAVVLKPHHTGVSVRNVAGCQEDIEWAELVMVLACQDGGVAVLIEALRPTWDALEEKARNVVLMRLEVVQEIVTGYRDGHHELRRPGEPRHPFGPGFGVSTSQRAEAMANILTIEKTFDRVIQRRVRDGELKNRDVGPSTIRNWIRNWEDEGILGLMDKRSLRQSKSWDLVDPRYRAEAERLFGNLSGDRSTVMIQEMDRRILLELRKNGIEHLALPQRMTGQYLSALKRRTGSKPVTQRGRVAQKVSGAHSFPAIRPGQVVAIDVTRADNLVIDIATSKPCSVEIITAIDVASRVVLALRVVPRSANGIEAGLLLYDICRPFSQVVSGTSISDWRWVGLPEQLDLSAANWRVEGRKYSLDLTTLQGEHGIPSVLPDAIHCDNAAIFLCGTFMALLRDLGIDLLLSRPGKPTDNPHIERMQGTIRRGLQRLPGYKGSNVSERGRLVAKEPCCTARELQDHLRRFIALDYHPTGHAGLILPGYEKKEVCPLVMWDAMVELTGRIDVPQRPDLIYQFLPIRWGVIAHAGVEFFNMTFDSEVLNPYRFAEKGTFRRKDSAAPFYVDPQDLSRIWFRDPDSNRVEAIEWRGANRVHAPMTSEIVNSALRLIRERGGNGALKRGAATRLIIKELGDIAASPTKKAWEKKLIAARMRVEQAGIDHGEAQDARDRLNPATSVDNTGSNANLRRPWPNLLDED